MDDSRSIRQLIESRKAGWALESRFYTDPEIYQIELDQIIMQNWIFAGHQSDLPAAGDFKVVKVANESAIIVRDQSGSLRAFANVCRHRGSLVCLEAEGNTRKFTCPYHGWTYDNEGHLVAARNMPDDFKAMDFSLHPVSLDIVHGLLFICFSASPPSLEAAKHDLAEPMALFDFENLKVAARKKYPISANWKLALENYNECYHCGPAHPDYAKLHTLMLDDTKIARVQGHMKDKMVMCGLKDIEIDSWKALPPEGEQGYHYSRTALFEGYKTGSRTGEAVAPLLGDLKGYDGGASDMCLGPFSFFLAYSDHVVGYVFTPIDLMHCQCEVYWLVRADAREGVDYDKETLMWLWDTTTYADEKIIVDNWKGVNSRFYEPGRYSHMEEWGQSWVDWLLRELKRAT